MRHIDKYYSFCYEALSAPNGTPSYIYLVDKANNMLITRKVSDSCSIENKWIELPKLSTLEKKDFLISFANEQKNNKFKLLMLDFADRFDDNSSFEIEKQLKKDSATIGLAQEFSFKRAVYLNNLIEKLYSKYGLNDNMTIQFYGIISSPDGASMSE